MAAPTHHDAPPAVYPVSVFNGKLHESNWYASAAYEGALQRVIVGLKHEGRTGLAKVLGARLAPVLCEVFKAGAGPPVIVLLPSRGKKIRERGYNHLQLICKNALRHLLAPPSNPSASNDRSASRGAQAGASPPSRRPGYKVPIYAKALKASPGRTGQVGLSFAERQLNARRVVLQKRFVRRLRGKQVVLVDDLITTSATVSAAVEVLRGAGVSVLGVAVLAVAQKRSEVAKKNFAREIGEAGSGNVTLN